MAPLVAKMRPTFASVNCRSSCRLHHKGCNLGSTASCGLNLHPPRPQRCGLKTEPRGGASPKADEADDVSSSSLSPPRDLKVTCNRWISHMEKKPKSPSDHKEGYLSTLRSHNGFLLNSQRETSLVVQRLTVCQCRGHESDPWSGKILHVVEQLSLCTTTPEPRSYRQGSAARGAPTVRSPRDAAKE